MTTFKHRCHANECQTAVPPKMFMCKRHWYMVPKWLRDAVWAHYTPGQEIRKDPTPEYMAVTAEAILIVAAQEGTCRG